MLGGHGYAVTWQNLEDPGVASELLCFSSITIPDNNDLHRIRREFGKHFRKTSVMVNPAHVSIAAEASPVGQKQE
eukprot:444948-Pelagomonas_calceolata.AAC.2